MLSNISIMEGLAGMPVKALTRITKHLDYPSLEMHLSTSQFFRDLPTDKHIDDAFLDLTMHYMDVSSTYEKVPCHNCLRLVGEDSHTGSNRTSVEEMQMWSPMLRDQAAGCAGNL